jgi:hypothetical protein
MSRGNSIGKGNSPTPIVKMNTHDSAQQQVLLEEEELILSTDRKMELDKLMCDGKDFFGRVNKELKTVTKELTLTRMGCQVSK